MFITRTPLRISFVGGGSDYQAFFSNSPGHVLGTTIDLYIYVSIVKHSSLAESKFRFSYSVSEDVLEPQKFKHPVVREMLDRFHDAKIGLHVATQADVPARTGLGSSSAFSVGLLHAILRLNNQDVSKEHLARESIRIEREVLQESGGWQDQYHAAYGGFALYEFNKLNVTRTEVPSSNFLRDSLLLVSVGSPRASTQFATRINANVATLDGQFLAKEMSNLAKNTYISISNALDDGVKRLLLAESMNMAWKLKQQISGGFQNPEVEDVMRIAHENGALAAKLCGAGGSGFVLIVCNPSELRKIQEVFETRATRVVNSVPFGSQSGPIDWEAKEN